MKMLVVKTLMVAVCTVLVVAGSPASANQPVRALGAQGPLGDERLSDETTVTRWAHAAQRAPVHSRPSNNAKPITRLSFWTEDRRAEVYLVLASRTIDTTTWLQIRIPGRPTGRTGWVHRTALSALQIVDPQLVINRQTLQATLFKNGRSIWTAPIGIGAPSTPTPAGRFYIRERLKGGGGTYGPWAFGTSAYSVLSDWPGGGVIGIHGTNQPALIPGRVSHGCIRVRNTDINRLARLMPIGTPVHII